MKMQFFWVADQVKMRNFDVHWNPGQENLANYFTKHFVGTNHREVKLWYLHKKNPPRYLPRAAAPSTLRGCVGTLANSYIKSAPLLPYTIVMCPCYVHLPCTVHSHILTIAPLHHCTIAPLQPYTLTPLHPYTLIPLYPYTLTPL